MQSTTACAWRRDPRPPPGRPQRGALWPTPAPNGAVARNSGSREHDRRPRPAARFPRTAPSGAWPDRGSSGMRARSTGGRPRAGTTSSRPLASTSSLGWLGSVGEPRSSSQVVLGWGPPTGPSHPTLVPMLSPWRVGTVGGDGPPALWLTRAGRFTSLSQRLERQHQRRKSLCTGQLRLDQ